MCFSLAWVEQLFIWLVIVGAIIALLKLLLPLVLGALGQAGGVIMSAIDIIVWAIVAIAVIYFVFALISCLLGTGGGLPLLPHK